MNKQLLFDNNLKLAHLPVDLNIAAVVGARVAIAKGEKVAIICQLGTSLASSLIFSFQQHTAASGGASKALSIGNIYYYKAGVATVFTQVEPSAKAATLDLSTVFSVEGGIVVIEVNQDDLDANNLYSHVSVDIADSTAAKLASTSYQVMNSQYCPAHLEAI